MKSEVQHQNQTVYIPIEQIESDPVKLRPVDAVTVEEMAESAKGNGIISPIEVRRIGPDHYRIIFGEHRREAAIRAGLSEIPCIVRESSEADALERKLIENLHRNAYIDPIVEGEIFARLVSEKYHAMGLLAISLGKNRQYVERRISLHEELIPELKEKLRAKEITLEGAIGLARLIPSEQHKAFEKLSAPRKDPERRIARERQGNRSKLEIIADMLRFEGEVPPTRVMYSSNLGWAVLMEYIAICENAGLIEEIKFESGTRRFYHVTPDGRNFVRTFDALMEKIGLAKSEV